MALTKKAILDLQARGFADAEKSARGVAAGMDGAADSTDRASASAEGLGRKLHEVGRIAAALATTLGGDKLGRELQSAFELGGLGARLGSALGPAGTVIGGVAGAALGFAKEASADDEREAKRREAEERARERDATHANTRATDRLTERLDRLLAPGARGQRAPTYRPADDDDIGPVEAR